MPMTSSIELTRPRRLAPAPWCFPSETIELLDFSLLAADDFLRGFSNISGSTILPHCFLMSFERFEMVTLKEYRG